MSEDHGTSHDDQDAEKTVGTAGKSDYRGADTAQAVVSDGEPHQKSSEKLVSNPRSDLDSETRPDSGTHSDQEVVGKDAELPADQDQEKRNPAEIIKEWKQKYQYGLAELDNLRKRGEREKAEAVRFGAVELARTIVPVLENLRRALASCPPDQRDGLPDDVKNVLIGIDMTEQLFRDGLEQQGIRREYPEVGSLYSYKTQQAVSEVETTEQAPGTIVQVLDAGYVMHGRLLKPASVIVAKTPNASDVQASGTVTPEVSRDVGG